MSRAVFLDRDGVLNQVVWRHGRPASPRTLAEFSLVPEAPSAVKRMKAAGWLALGVTNQPDLARGRLLALVHQELCRQLLAAVPLDDLAVCPHDDDHECLCRKPRPGLVWDLARRWEVVLAQSFLVGDTWRDMECARSAGCRGILLETAYNMGVPADFRVASLEEAVGLITGDGPGARP